MIEIEEKYYNLLWLLIHDKRTSMNGILSDLQITPTFGGYHISYHAYMNGMSNYSVFVDDIEKGSVIFLLPFGVKYMEKEMEEMAEWHTQAIKDFFGEKFREDMIMKISEDERQEEIRKWDSLTIGLEKWENKLYNEKISSAHWEKSDIPCEGYKCSVCGGAAWYYDSRGGVAKSRFCPTCGAKMDLR